MAPSKAYELVTTNFKRTRAELREEGSANPAYELEFSFALADLMSSKPGRHAITLRTPSSNHGATPTVLGSCDFTFSSLSTPIHLAFGDLASSPDTVVYEDVHQRNKWALSDFELCVDLGGSIGRKTFDWRRTHDVEGKSTLGKKLDVLHLKMTDRDTDTVVARFIHHFSMGSKRGRLEFDEYDGGPDWDRIVILSGLATLEYMRKAQGWSL